MKKLIIIVLLALSSAVYANDFYREYLELKTMIESVEASRAVTAEKDKIEAITETVNIQIDSIARKNPHLFSSLATAYRNTYFWYLWQDYDKGTPLQQLEIVNIVNSITKEK